MFSHLRLRTSCQTKVWGSSRACADLAALYWSVMTVTTVGYGDIAPQTVLGQMLASLMMILGYAIIAVPTGIVGAELARTNPVDTNTQACPGCGAEGHEDDAVHCKHCGHKL